MFMILYKEQIRIDNKKIPQLDIHEYQMEKLLKKPDGRVQKCKMCAKDTLEENVIKSSQIKSN
jgi:hypothetical protein